jgi:hypothetical protein
MFWDPWNELSNLVSWIDCVILRWKKSNIYRVPFYFILFSWSVQEKQGKHKGALMVKLLPNA